MNSGSFSLRRAAGLARWNVVLLTRNRLAFFYAIVMPLLPLVLLLTGDRGDKTVGASSMTTLFLVAGLFPVYYNVLSQWVNRRDELVLKRMRTGEARDSELIVSVATPGAAAALTVIAVSIPAAAALGQPVPVNPIALALGAFAAVTMFTAFAYWTAAWTRNAEAAQLTSLPIILLASVGPLFASLSGLSDAVENLIKLTPGAAMGEIVRVTWFGFDGTSAKTTTLNFSEVWANAGQPLLVLIAWTLVGVGFARRSMRWEPRS